MNVSSQILYQLVINHGPTMFTGLTNFYSSYFNPKKSVVHMIQDVDDERELDLLQMDRLLKWMSIIFEIEEEEKNDTEPETNKETNKETDNETIKTIKENTIKKYKQELFSIYKSIYCDYKDYQRWKKHNRDLWMFSSYRQYDTKSLAKRILSDVKLFNEGLKMFSVFNK